MVKQNIPTIRMEEVPGKTLLIGELASSLLILGEQWMKVRNRLSKEWAVEKHTLWEGWGKVKAIFEGTYRIRGEKARARSALLIKKLKASKAAIEEADFRSALLIKKLKASKTGILQPDMRSATPIRKLKTIRNGITKAAIEEVGAPLWGAIAKGIGLDEMRLIIEEDIFRILEELRHQIEEGKVKEAFEVLFSVETQEKFQRLQAAGEGELITDVRKFMSRASRIKDVFEGRRNVLGRYYNYLKNMRLDADSLSNLIKVVKGLVALLERSNPNDKLLGVIRGKSILLHLEMYDKELKYFEELLSNIRKSPAEGGWYHFLNFYDQRDELVKFKGNLDKIRNVFGDSFTANELERAGNKPTEFGDQPLAWIKEIESLNNRLKSKGYAHVLVNVGSKSLLEAIAEEDKRLQQAVMGMLKKQLENIKDKVQSRIGKLEDVRPVVKSILKDRNKSLVKFLKRTRREFRQREKAISMIYWNKREFLESLPKLAVDREKEFLKKGDECKKAALQRLGGSMLGIRQLAMDIKEGRGREGYSHVPEAQKISHYGASIERIEEPHIARIKKLFDETIPTNMGTTLPALEQLKVLLQEALSYLEVRGFIENAQIKSNTRKGNIIRLEKNLDRKGNQMAAGER